MRAVNLSVVDVQKYLQQRQHLSEQEPQFRTRCMTCMQPSFSCYCEFVQPFDPQITFVILIHPIEVRRRIATGRMSHLCLKNSLLIRGQTFADDKRINKLIHDPQNYPVMLYPGVQSINLTTMTPSQRAQIFPQSQRLIVFVIDGTWTTAKKMVNQSPNLKALPRICFEPERPSNFRVRKQPHENCYSTIEAIHQTIELIGPTQNFSVESRTHDRLLTVFNAMVERQIEFMTASKSTATYRRRGFSSRV